MNEKEREVMQQALEALEKHQEALRAWPEHTLAPHECVAMDASEKAITALRAALAHQAEPVQEKNSAPEKLPVPKEWYTEPAITCFAKSYNGEGSYYCPHCDTNAGSVWVDHAWRPTKWQAICYNCRNSFNEQG